MLLTLVATSVGPAAASTYTPVVPDQFFGFNGTFWQAHTALPYVPAEVYEIYNEENLPNVLHCGTDQAFPASLYAQIYAGSRSAIRAVDAQARVIVGGLNETPGGESQAEG